MPTTIEWTDETWNPVTGCEKVSPGCKHCYAETFAERFRNVVMPNGRLHVFHDGFDPQLRPERLHQPFCWRSPKMVFVNSMSDLFGDFVPDDYLGQVFSSLRDMSKLIDVLRSQLVPYGYHQDAVRSIPVQNQQNTVLYYLVYVSKHPMGNQIWERITRITAHGQRLLI